MKRIYERPEDATKEYWDSDASWMDAPDNEPSFLLLPRVCRSKLREFQRSELFVYTIVLNSPAHPTEFFLWALYRDAFKSDESLPERDISTYGSRILTMEDIIREVKEGTLAECAIARAMELML